MRSRRNRSRRRQRSKSFDDGSRLTKRVVFTARPSQLRPVDIDPDRENDRRLIGAAVAYQSISMPARSACNLFR